MIFSYILSVWEKVHHYNYYVTRRIRTISNTNQYQITNDKLLMETKSIIQTNVYNSSHFFKLSVGIPMDTSCDPLVADLFLFCYERHFMISLSED